MGEGKKQKETTQKYTNVVECFHSFDTQVFYIFVKYWTMLPLKPPKIVYMKQCDKFREKMSL